MSSGERRSWQGINHLVPGWIYWLLLCHYEPFSVCWPGALVIPRRSPPLLGQIPVAVATLPFSGFCFFFYFYNMVYTLSANEVNYGLRNALSSHSEFSNVVGNHDTFFCLYRHKCFLWWSEDIWNALRKTQLLIEFFNIVVGSHDQVLTEVNQWFYQYFLYLYNLTFFFLDEVN